MENEIKEKYLGSRTEFDFSNHELIVEDGDGILVHTLKHRDYEKMDRFNFINTNDIMVVTGDYGNWLFCREFHPSSTGRVSDYHWCEKIQYSSTQKPLEFDNDATEEEIRNGINGELEDDGYSDEALEELVEFYEDVLLYNVNESEERYMINAIDNMPSHMDSESIPHITKINRQLLCVFDAFEEICRLLKVQEDEAKLMVDPFENNGPTETQMVVREAMRMVQKDVRDPKCVRDGLVKKKNDK